MNRLVGLHPATLIALAVAAAVAVNLVVYGIGRIAGASYEFTAATGPAAVDPVTLIGFTVVPLTLGLTITAILGRWWRGVFIVAMVVAPILELGSIFGMTVPADLDPASTVALAACHLALVPITLLTLVALRRRDAARRGIRIIADPVAA